MSGRTGLGVCVCQTLVMDIVAAGCSVFDQLINHGQIMVRPDDDGGSRSSARDGSVPDSPAHGSHCPQKTNHIPHLQGGPGE